MRHIHYIEIENFKCFGERQRIEFGETTVLMGPNDCGKTTVLEALMLWRYEMENFWFEDDNSQWQLANRAVLGREVCQAVPGASVAEFFYDRSKVATELSSQKTGKPMMLRKGNLHELIPDAELFDVEELTEKLDAIHRLLVDNRIENKLRNNENIESTDKT